ncbi:MAG: GNAT family N-acetyltransferase [Acidobacteria bacterium]|nr:GNAT family N-acetyltransferase [Acidobacteriota bacterium]
MERAEAVAFRPPLPAIEIREAQYTMRFAQSLDELDAVFKLRFEIFNLELAEGLDESFHTGRDHDEFDATCHHLIIIETATGNIVGTYRLQTMETATRGFYSAGEFDLSHLPGEVLAQSVELGRACIASAHRSPQVLFLLWKGLAAYLLHTGKRYLFGCCSLTSQDASEGKAVLNLLEQGGHMHDTFSVPPQKACECFAPDFQADAAVATTIPKLFRIYLRYGAKVCGRPAIDHRFKTIDFFVIFDLTTLDVLSRVFFGL